MAYIFNIPAAPDQLSVSQGQIQNNFIALGAIAGKGTVQSNSLNISAGFNFVYLPVQPLTPPITFPAGDVGLYSYNNATTLRNELYANHTIANGTLVQTPATASILGVGAALPGTLTSGWTYLPSGIIIQWVTKNGLAAGPQSQPWPITFPTQVLSMQVSSRGAGLTNILAGTPTAANWAITVPAGVTQAFIFGIGY